MKYSREPWIQLSSVTWKLASSTKPEVQNTLHCHQRKLTSAENFMKFGEVGFDRAYIYTYIHTLIKVTICVLLCNEMNFNQTNFQLKNVLIMMTMKIVFKTHFLDNELQLHTCKFLLNPCAYPINHPLGLMLKGLHTGSKINGENILQAEFPSYCPNHLHFNGWFPGESGLDSIRGFCLH